MTKRNNTDQILDRLINWQYFLPPIKFFYILPKSLQLQQLMGLKFELNPALTVKCISAVASAIGFTKVFIALENSQLAIANALVLLAIIVVSLANDTHLRKRNEFLTRCSKASPRCSRHPANHHWPAKQQGPPCPEREAPRCTPNHHLQQSSWYPPCRGCYSIQDGLWLTTTEYRFLSLSALACGMTRLPKTQRW